MPNVHIYYCKTYNFQISFVSFHLLIQPPHYLCIRWGVNWTAGTHSPTVGPSPGCFPRQRGCGLRAPHFLGRSYCQYQIGILTKHQTYCAIGNIIHRMLPRTAKRESAVWRRSRGKECYSIITVGHSYSPWPLLEVMWLVSNCQKKTLLNFWIFSDTQNNHQRSAHHNLNIQQQCKNWPHFRLQAEL